MLISWEAILALNPSLSRRLQLVLRLQKTSIVRKVSSIIAW